jgi:hypothetical protein
MVMMMMTTKSTQAHRVMYQPPGDSVEGRKARVLQVNRQERGAMREERRLKINGSATHKEREHQTKATPLLVSPTNW